MSAARTLMRMMNKLPLFLLRSPLHGVMSKSVLLVTFAGRKSGKAYATPISYIRQADIVFFTTDSPWWKNLRGGAVRPALSPAQGVGLRRRGLHLYRSGRLPPGGG